MSAASENRGDMEHGETGETRDSAPTFPGAGLPTEALAHAPSSSFQDTTHLIVEMLATLSHEFRTPLTVITGSASTLLRRTPQLSSAEQQEFLQMIQEAGQRLERLSDRLLEIAQLEAGAFQLDADLVDLSALAREAIARAERHVPDPLRERFTFQLQCRDATGNQTQEVPPVKGDVRALRKVLDHLLENATRFSPAGGRIDVIVRPAPHGRTGSGADQSTGPSFLEICVCDFGRGIPPEDLERIFERFYRVDTRLIREVGGLGLGLTLCKYFVELHGGRLWAESCSAGGSAFHLWLPFEAFPSLM
jgi:signal transduction histidine kinase